MPPSQETPLEKDIANTNLNLDISKSVLSTARKTHTTNNPLIFSKPPAGEDKGKSKVSFLTLPIEIRLQIYDILLISRIDDQKQLMIYKDRCPQAGILPTWRHIHYGGKSILCSQNAFQFFHINYAQSKILQTCRQMYHEGKSVLYSHNDFYFPYVDHTLEFIEQIGLVNFRSIRSLYIRVDNLSIQPSFLGLFNILSEEENGVRVMEYTYGNSGRVSGTGDKLDFIRTLEKTKEITREGKEAFISLQDGRYRLSSRINVWNFFSQKA